MRGKMNAFGAFRDVLAADMASALPELGDDVRRVCEATGGKVPPGVGVSTAATVTTTSTSGAGDVEMPGATPTGGTTPQQGERSGNTA